MPYTSFGQVTRYAPQSAKLAAAKIIGRFVAKHGYTVAKQAFGHITGTRPNIRSAYGRQRYAKAGLRLKAKYGAKRASQIAQGWKGYQSNKMKYNPTTFQSKGIQSYKGKRSGYITTSSKVFSKKNTAAVKRIYPHLINNKYFYNANPVILTVDTNGDGTKDSITYNAIDFQPNGTLMKLRMDSVANYGDSSFIYREISLPFPNSGIGLGTFQYSYPYQATVGATVYPPYASIGNFGVCVKSDKASIYKPLIQSSVINPTDSGSFFDYLLESVTHDLTVTNNTTYKCLFNVMIVRMKINTVTGGTSLLQPLSRDMIGSMTNMLGTADKQEWHTVHSKSIVLPPISDTKRFPQKLKIRNWLGYTMSSSRPVYNVDYSSDQTQFGKQISKTYGASENDKLNNRTFLVMQCKSLNQRPVQKINNIAIGGSDFTQSMHGTQIFSVDPTSSVYNGTVLQRSNVNIEVSGSTSVKYRLREAITNSLMVPGTVDEDILKDKWNELTTNNVGFPDKGTAWAGSSSADLPGEYCSNPRPHQEHPDDLDFIERP